MKKMLLVIYDSKAEMYMNPFSVPTLGVAYRNLADEVARVSDPSNQFAHHAGDFELYRLGVFDDESGEIVAEKEPRLVCRLSDLKVEASQE